MYLDGQEYSSESYRDEEEQEYLDCLGEATTPTQVHHCEDRGVHFGLNLHEAGIPVRYKYYAYRWHYSYAVQQHHKYIIVDDERVASGSYNFSNNAEHDSFENIIFFEGGAYSAVVEDFVSNFETIWNTGRTGLYESLLAQITETEDDFPLVFDSMALSWPETLGTEVCSAGQLPRYQLRGLPKHPQNHSLPAVGRRPKRVLGEAACDVQSARDDRGYLGRLPGNLRPPGDQIEGLPGSILCPGFG